MGGWGRKEAKKWGADSTCSARVISAVAATTAPAIARLRLTLEVEGVEALPAPGTNEGHPTRLKGTGAMREETVASAAGGLPLGGMMTGEGGRVGVTEEEEEEVVIEGGESMMTEGDIGGGKVEVVNQEVEGAFIRMGGAEEVAVVATSPGSKVREGGTCVNNVI